MTLGKPVQVEGMHRTPSAGINYKMFLLVAGIVGIAFFAGMMIQGDGDSANPNSVDTVDTNTPSADIGADIGQGSGPSSQPVAVETETPEEETKYTVSDTIAIWDLPDEEPAPTPTPEIAGKGEVGKTGIYYPVDNLPREIESENIPGIKVVDARIENNKLKFSIKNTGSGECVRYDIYALVYRGEPYNQEVRQCIPIDGYKVYLRINEEEKIVSEDFDYYKRSYDGSSYEVRGITFSLR